MIPSGSISRLLVTCIVALLCTSCGDLPPAASVAPQTITVAAASNLSQTIQEIGDEFTYETGIEVVFSFGSTTTLAQQIENGAPFDVFAAADTEHVDQLVERGWIVPESRAIYARGRLAAWHPDRDNLVLDSLEDLAKPEVKYVAIANPELAPYGAAAVELLKSTGLWDAVEPKLVYGNNVTQAKQLADTGNADAALIAYSLVARGATPDGLVGEATRGHLFGGDGFFYEGFGRGEDLHRPLDQALGVIANSQNRDAGQRFADFMLGLEGQAVLERGGYTLVRRVDEMWR